MPKSAHEDILTTSGQWKASDKELKNQLGTEDALFKLISDIFKKAVDTIIANSNSNPPTGSC